MKELINKLSVETLNANQLILLIITTTTCYVIYIMVKAVIESRSKNSITSFISKQSEFNKTQLEFNNTITGYISSIKSGLLVEATYEQIIEFSDVKFNETYYKTLEEIKKIINENHIHERERIEKKVDHIITNLQEERNISFDLFHYKNKSLTSYVEEKWIRDVVNTCIENIYREGGFSYNKFEKDLTITYNYIKNKFNKNLKS